MDRERYRSEFKEVSGEVGWTLRKVFWRIFLPLIALSMVLGAVGWGIKILSQPARIIEKTLDADNVLYNYEWFKSAYQDIGALTAQIVNAQSALEQFTINAPPRREWDYPTTTEYSRLNSILLGLKNQRLTQVATYNARSKMANRNIFKTGELPDHIE